MGADAIVIVAAKRTPTGAFQGVLQTLSAPQLGAHVLKAVLAQAQISRESVDAVILGCVLSAGLGQAPARQAALQAGLSNSVDCVTVNKVCGSGLKAIMMAHDMIQAGSLRCVIAGGMESMSNAPYLVPNARQGLKMGHAQLLDHMMLEGLQDAGSGMVMGLLAEKTVERYNCSRAQQDAFARQSAEKALRALKEGWFQEEVAPLSVSYRKENLLVTEDEPPKKINLEKIPFLSPAFKKDGTLTAANSSSLSDGASCVLMMPSREAQKRVLRPLARIVAHASFSREPEWFTLAPQGAIQKVLKRAEWAIETVDLFEINEAFGVVALVCAQDCGIPLEKVNIHGGACALGHPIGATGARLLTTLVYALKTHNKKRGIATLCIGGGEAVAIAVERLV